MWAKAIGLPIAEICADISIKYLHSDSKTEGVNEVSYNRDSIAAGEAQLDTAHSLIRAVLSTGLGAESLMIRRMGLLATLRLPR